MSGLTSLPVLESLPYRGLALPVAEADGISPAKRGVYLHPISIGGPGGHSELYTPHCVP